MRAGWRRAIHASRGVAASASQRIQHSGRDGGDLVIRLVPLAAETERPAIATIRVPTRLPRQLHPIVAATRDIARPGPDGWVDTMRRPGVIHLRLTRQNLNRALRIGQAIFREATRRGHRVEATGSSRGCSAGACLAIGGQRFELTLAEQTTRVPHIPTAEEEARAQRYEWAHVPKWNYVATGRLHFATDTRPTESWPRTERGGSLRIDSGRCWIASSTELASSMRRRSDTLPLSASGWSESARTGRRRCVQRSSASSRPTAWSTSATRSAAGMKRAGSGPSSTTSGPASPRHPAVSPRSRSGWHGRAITQTGSIHCWEQFTCQTHRCRRQVRWDRSSTDGARTGRHG